MRETAFFPERRYRFVHPLVQQVAYQSLLLKSRAELHARAGRALEAVSAERPEEALQELARHYSRSAEPDKALHYLALAGDRSRSLFAYDDAAVYYRQALGVRRRRRPARRALLEKLGDSRLRARRARSEARAEWGRALTLVERTASGRRAAELDRKIGVAGWDAGERQRALDHLERGRAALGDDTDNAEAARLYQELGRIHFRLGNHEARPSGRGARWRWASSSAPPT